MGGCGTITLIFTLILALLCAIATLIVAIVGLADPNNDNQWKLHWWYKSNTNHQHTAAKPWRENRNASFVIGIYCVFLIIVACIEILSCFLILIFRRNYIVRYILRFLRFVEGHGVFLMLLGVFAIGIAGNSGILVGAFTLCAGALLVVIALLLRCIDPSASWGEYRVFHFSKK